MCEFETICLIQTNIACQENMNILLMISDWSKILFSARRTAFTFLTINLRRRKKGFTASSYIGKMNKSVFSFGGYFISYFDTIISIILWLEMDIELPEWVVYCKRHSLTKNLLWRNTDHFKMQCNDQVKQKAFITVHYE